MSVCVYVCETRFDKFHAYTEMQSKEVCIIKHIKHVCDDDATLSVHVYWLASVVADV